MALPQMTTPFYKVQIPSTGQEITFRPFLVREEKALLLSQQSEDTDVMINTLKEVLTGCIKEPINPDNLAIFDVEYLFTQIRAKSVGEVVELIFTCAHCDEEKNKVKLEVDLTKIPIVKDPNHTNKISLFGDVGVIMKYPNLSTFKKAEGKSEDINAVMEVVIDCIDAIYTGDEVFYAKEQTRAELENFVMNLTKAQFDLLENFFVSIPKYKQEIEFDCPACNTHNKTVVEGPASFF
jgi:Zn finger protein HypA/HybF involved in hydrogenase expression